MNTNINDCKLIEIPKIHNEMGTLSVVEGSTIPFQIKSVSQLHGREAKTPNGQAYKNRQCFFVALHGSFDMLLQDGDNEKRIHLNRPDQGLFIPSGIWIEIQNVSAESVCLKIASTLDEAQDDINDYSQFELSKNG